MHRGGFEPPYLLRGTDLQSVGFNHSPTCANPKTSAGNRPAQTTTPQPQLSARETKCENSRLTPNPLPENNLKECLYYGATRARRRANLFCFRNLFIWSWRRESNPRPSDYKSDALPTELRQQVEASAFRAHYSSVALREVRDNYLSYHKGIARATGTMPLPIRGCGRIYSLLRNPASYQGIASAIS